MLIKKNCCRYPTLDVFYPDCSWYLAERTRNRNESEEWYFQSETGAQNEISILDKRKCYNLSLFVGNKSSGYSSIEFSGMQSARNAMEFTAIIFQSLYSQRFIHRYCHFSRIFFLTNKRIFGAIDRNTYPFDREL